MHEQGFILTQHDRDVLQQALDIIHQLPKELLTSSNYSRLQNIPHGPETYIAITPVGGIPALTTSGTAGTLPGSADCEIYQLAEGQLLDMGFTETVYNLSTSAVAGNTYVLVTREKSGYWQVIFSTAATKLLVQITARTYPSGGTPFAVYSCNLSVDNIAPSALTYTATIAGPDFYNINDVDLPIGLVCWISKSDNGSWYLNDNDTRVDVIQKTGAVPDANGLYDGTLYRYDDVTHTIEARGAIKVLDITGP